MQDLAAGVSAQPVVVCLHIAFPPKSVAWAHDVPLWVRASGFNVADEAPGELDGWALSSVGRWWASVRFQVRSSNSALKWELDQLVPAEAVRPR